MPQNPQETTNPGLVNVADQGDGPLAVDQAVVVGPSQNPALAVPAVASGGLGGSPSTSTNPDLEDVADQAFDGLPSNTFVP